MVLFVCHKMIVKNLTKFSHMQLKMGYSIALHHTKKNASFTDLLLYCIVHKLHPCIVISKYSWQVHLHYNVLLTNIEKFLIA